jgi:invasion protein IalB
MRISLLAFALAGSLALTATALTSAALAQDQTPPAPAAATPAPAAPAGAAPAAPAAPQPQVTTTAFGDWTLRCTTATPPAQAGQAAPAPVKHCELDQSIGVNGQPNPIAQLAIDKDKGSNQYQFIAALPIAAWLPGPVAFQATPKAKPVPLAYKRCLPNACFADAPLSADLSKAMQNGGDTKGALTFQMTAGKSSGLPVSFNGFKAGLAALQAAQ